jgi:hypothetical protein
MYMDILRFVVENGRVQADDDGFNLASLETEVEFEARERGWSDEQVKAAVEFARSRYA